jgi:hypothetical protein
MKMNAKTAKIVVENINQMIPTGLCKNFTFIFDALHIYNKVLV